VVYVGEVFRKAVEDRKKRLIDMLIAFNVYKKDDKHLFELTLSELENEYRKSLSNSHPHGEYGSIHWIGKKS
jgi:hypothetical protein